MAVCNRLTLRKNSRVRTDAPLRARACTRAREIIEEFVLASLYGISENPPAGS
jgi:hypothetical protein